MSPWILSIPVAYLLGSIPFGYILVRTFRKEDIRETGSGNIGATNVVRSGAVGLGVATLALDLGKASAAVIFAQHISPGNLNMVTMAAIAVIVGHIFPVWLGFRGGKGVASLIGVALALDWRVGLGVSAAIVLVVLLTRYVSLGSIVGAGSLPFFAMAFIRPRTPLMLTGMVLIAALIIIRHGDNIRRLVAGTENRLGRSKAGAQAPVHDRRQESTPGSRS